MTTRLAGRALLSIDTRRVQLPDPGRRPDADGFGFAEHTNEQEGRR